MEYTTDRRGPDGLTREERASLRDPRTFEVLELNPCRFVVSSREAFADFDVILAYGRWIRIKSNTGSVIDWQIGEECPCMDSVHRDGHCKHATVLGVVLEYRAAQGEREFLAQKKAA
jgi:hypothetical protein